MSFELGLAVVAVANLAVLVAVAAGLLPWSWMGVAGGVLAVYLVLFLVDQYRQWRDWNAANAAREQGSRPPDPGAVAPGDGGS